MSREMINISNAAQDVANAAREAYALLRATRRVPSAHIASAINGLDETVHEEFAKLAGLLGYSVAKIEPATLQAAE